MTVGGSGGMVNRKTRAKATNKAKRSLRSQTDPEEERAMETTDEDEEKGKGARPKTHSAQPATSEFLGLMRSFMDEQQRREEGFLRELRETLRPARGPEGQHSQPYLRRAAVEPSAGAGRADDDQVLPPEDASPHRASLERGYGHDPKMPVYQQGEDIENYLLRFERMARTWQWPTGEWACRLVPLLTGRALEAYSAMDEDQADCYEELKEALLQKFDISAETYRQRFRGTAIPPGETPTETYYRLKGLYRRWIRPEQLSKEDVGEAIILEQLLQVFPADIRMWVKEHEPQDGQSAAKLAQQYLNARKGVPPRHFSSLPRGTRDIRDRHGTGGNPGSWENRRSETGRDRDMPRAGKGLICFYCQQPGHKASVCPARKPKFSSYCYVPREEDKLQKDNDATGCYNVMVNGQVLQALLDTGSVMSLIKACYVPEGSISYSHTTSIQCVHGDQKCYPMAEVTVTVNDLMYLLNVGVVADLPVDMVLGRDMPVLHDLLALPCEGTEPVANVIGAVLTRAQAKAGLQPLPDFCDSLVEGGTKGPRKPRRQRRVEKYLGRPIVKPEAPGLKAPHWEIPEDIANLQVQDKTLQPLFAKISEAGEGRAVNHCREELCIEGGVLYVRDGEKQRLVVPKSCRHMVLELAHTIPWSGHLAHQKTYQRISSRFFWPSMYTDVMTFCKTCPTCQYTSTVRKSDRAPLYPLPVISTPFKRIGMDIVGPLEKSQSGYQYILVICDYATRYPEAFPLRSITTPKVISALVQLFSRVGFPEEILTDQGTNFTSRLMKQLHHQLGITAIRTTPYHPQTDGLVERFNQTLKNMLRKFVSDTGKDWDKWLPFLLFAYREVPQASTGFSPFELLYGWSVQGPLDLLKKSWETPASGPGNMGVVQYVLQMRDQLEQYREEAQENLKKAQHNQKRWYDEHARRREYQPNQKVLLLLPTATSKLLAKWQGPYTITRKMGPVTYEIHHPDRGKQKQTYHINLIKEWKEREESPAKALMVRKVEEDEGPCDLRVWQEQSPVDLSHLSEDQRLDLQQVFRKYPGLFQESPGKTSVLQHAVHLKDPTPIRQRPYRIPERLLEPLRKEIRTMKELGVIEASCSEWCSPVVIVPKKDGTLRVCMDFRKLNAVSRFDAYPMPRIDDLIERIGRARYITTLDLCKGYWQVPLEEKSREYTAFQTPMGLFQFTVMPFGLHGAPATFQRLMDRVLQGCEDCCAAYLDDVVIYSDTWANHLCHLQRVLSQIHDAGLSLNQRKCDWAGSEAQYLGYHLGGGQIRPQVDKLEAISNSSRPHTKKQVRSFLGLVGWYRRFIPDFATIAAPLTDLTTKSAKNPVEWTKDCDQAFTTLKTRLCSSPVLQSPDFTKRFLVQVDASAVGLGAVLAQGEPGEERPVLYLSRKLLPRETRYSTIEKECLAMKWALDSLRYYLLGREFDLDTDHRALTWFQSMKDRNARVTRWYLALQPFRFHIRHKAGKQNITADYLSRLPLLANLEEKGGNVTVGSVTEDDSLPLITQY